MTDHDAGNRSLFSDKRFVADLIRGFVDEPWTEQLDLETLERVSGSFVSLQFKRRENDVVWRVRFRGDWLYVYLLIEFQSTVDRFMALRLMVYVGLLYQRLIDEDQVGRKKLLPPVLPIVLYNGRKPWWAPRDVAELMANCPEQLARYRPRMRYFLLDEHMQEDAKLAEMENLVALVFRFEQCRSREDFERVIDAMVAWAGAGEHRESVKRLARWVESIVWPGRLPDQSVVDLDDIQECGAMLKEQVKEWEKALIEKGIEQGVEQGIEKGKADFLSSLIQRKFGIVPAPLRRRIDAANSEQLLAWAERVLSAERIDDVFGM